MCFFAVTGGTIAVLLVFYHGNGLHGNYRSKDTAGIFFKFFFFLVSDLSYIHTYIHTVGDDSEQDMTNYYYYYYFRT